MSAFSLRQLLESLHDDLESRLATVRKAIGHPGSKGDASETVWVELLNTYLPARYQAASAHVVDSLGVFSDQIDIVVFDRQYTPFIFKMSGQAIVPAEGVYAVFEAKQTIDASLVRYAQEKVASVRRLYRTSLPIPFVEGTLKAKSLPHILGGIVALDSEWNPPLGEPLSKALEADSGDGRLDIGCVASFGSFARDEDGGYHSSKTNKPATSFLFELIARLQASATVPMIDVRAYAKWLIDPVDERIA